MILTPLYIYGSKQRSLEKKGGFSATAFIPFSTVDHLPHNPLQPLSAGCLVLHVSTFELVVPVFTCLSVEDRMFQTESEVSEVESQSTVFYSTRVTCSKKLLYYVFHLESPFHEHVCALIRLEVPVLFYVFMKTCFNIYLKTVGHCNLQFVLCTFFLFLFFSMRKFVSWS